MSEKKPIDIHGTNPVCFSFTSDINPSSTPILLGALMNAVNEGRDEIHLFISTPGGLVADGIAGYNAIQALPVPVYTYNIGNVDSIGNVLFQAGERRIAAPISSFMFHGVGFDIQNMRFEMKQLNERTASIQNDQSLIAEIMAKRTNLSVGDVEELFLRTAYLRANEAFDRGLTDEVREIFLPKNMPLYQLIIQR